MNLVDRARKIIVSPRTEWDVIAGETTPTGAIITGYVLPLAAVAAVAGFIGMTFVGMFGVRYTLVAGLVQMILQVVMAVASVFLLGYVIDALAPTFGGEKNLLQATKVAAYSYTPVWVVSILSIIPALGMLVILAALYAIYLLYLGLPRLMKAPQEKAAGYTAVVVVVAIVIGFIVGLVVGGIGAAVSPSSPLGMGTRTGLVVDKDSAAGKMEDFARKMEAAGKKMEAAQKSGDPNKQVEAAMAAVGTAMSGGKGVEPVQIDALKPFAPEKFAGLPKASQQSDRSGFAGMMVAKVETEYAAGDRRVQLEIVDTGGVAGLMTIAAWAGAGASSEREDGERRERMRREGNRVVHEEVHKQGGPNKYSVLLADRYMVAAEGEGVDIATLKSAVGSIDLAKLEALR